MIDITLKSGEKVTYKDGSYNWYEFNPGTDGSLTIYDADGLPFAYYSLSDVSALKLDPIKTHEDV